MFDEQRENIKHEHLFLFINIIISLLGRINLLKYLSNLNHF